MANKKITIDANTAVAKIGYLLSEVVGIYPITPSTSMAEAIDVYSSDNKKNIFGQKVDVIEMQSEAGAAGVVHGALIAGSLSSTYTASQGLLLMIPSMYKIAAERLPSVFHVASRTIATHAINIFNEHSDVMAVRQTGFNMLCSNNVQESHDLALIAHIAAIKSSLPFVHFFDGFRTSHEINKINEIPLEVVKQLTPYEAIEEFKDRAHSPTNPKQSGTCQNADLYFQNREAINPFYNNVYDIVEQAMKDFGKLTKRVYKPFMYSGNTKADTAIVCMGSACDTINITNKFLNKKNKKVGLVKVHLYRPFNAKAFVKCLPKTIKNLIVLDNTKEPNAVGEPLYLDVCSALKEYNSKINVIGGRYGLGGKDLIPDDVIAIYNNIWSKKFKNHFTIGINDDVTNTSLPKCKNVKFVNDLFYSCKFIGYGSDGTVGASKSLIKIIGNNSNKFVQGYFQYDSKKSGGITISHLRIANDHINAPYLIANPDFISINHYAYIGKMDLLKGLKKNGIVLINTSMSVDQLSRDLPEDFKKQLKDTSAKVYTIPAFTIANQLGLHGKINTIMESCFFKINKILNHNEAIKYVINEIKKDYYSKGNDVVNRNIKAVKTCEKYLKQINVNDLFKHKSSRFVHEYANKYFQNFINPVQSLDGDSLPVSSFEANGFVKTNTAKFEKRGIAEVIPHWIAENCIQCGQCSLVCPHGAIRTYLFTKEQALKAPKGMKLVDAIGIKDTKYAVQVSPYDCTGCMNCVSVCPAIKKALVGKSFDEVKELENSFYEFCDSLNEKINQPFKKETVKGLQFHKPYFEFSGACSGCGEAAYIKVLTQLFGDQLLIANATGCSSIYSASAPTCPFTKDEDGHGPSWTNSLFEDNAEFGLGIHIAKKHNKQKALKELNKFKSLKNKELNKIIDEINNEQIKSNYKVLERLETKLRSLKKSLPSINDLANTSTWIIGGDGWAYDIGFGGLDHIMSTNENVNVLVLNTEAYSNTGGQASKATPIGSAAKLSSSGKTTNKKDLGEMMMSYKHVYVAQVSMGANKQQLIDALVEANNYPGPSIVIAYAPCIAHGIDMHMTQLEMKKAVESGYWSLYRYNPLRKDPMTIDSINTDNKKYQEFLLSENRYRITANKNKANANKFFNESFKDAKSRQIDLKNIK